MYACVCVCAISVELIILISSSRNIEITEAVLAVVVCLMFVFSQV